MSYDKLLKRFRNRFFYRLRFTEDKFRQLVSCFAMDLAAIVTAKITGISLRSVNTICLRIRQRLAEACEQASPFVMARLKRMNPTSVPIGFAVDEGVLSATRRFSLVCSCVRVWFTQKSLLDALMLSSIRLSGVTSIGLRSFFGRLARLRWSG